MQMLDVLGNQAPEVIAGQWQLVTIVLLYLFSLFAFLHGAVWFSDRRSMLERHKRQRAESLASLMAYAALLRAQVEFERDTAQRSDRLAA